MITRPLSALPYTAAQTSLRRKTSQQTKFIDLNQAKYVKDFLEELAKKDSRYATGEFQIII